jgi:hypothetical protein
MVEVRWLLGVGLLCAGLADGVAQAANDDEGFMPLFDGRTLAGWQASENAASWSVADGQIICHGPRSHLFYVGADPAAPAVFKDFHFRAEVMTKPGSNSGIFIHSKFQAEGWPVHGYEVQVNNSQRDPVRTGSLYNTVKIFTPPAQDDKWFTMDVVVRGRAVTVTVDGKVLYEFVEPEGTSGTRRLSEGPFSLQAPAPDSIVHYRNIRAKRLP